MKKLISLLSKRMFFVVFVLVLFLIVATSFRGKTNYVANISNIKSLQAMHIIQKYDNLKEDLEIKHVSNMFEVKQFGSSGPVSFTGQMTAYGPDCVGCSGIVACPPRLDVRNNIYYEDNEYGKIRILAADRAIPCGSIIRINNLTFSSEPVIGIVLDRGGVIKGNIIDFLVGSEQSSDPIGRRKNILFEIIRWGW